MRVLKLGSLVVRTFVPNSFCNGMSYSYKWKIILLIPNQSRSINQVYLLSNSVLFSVPVGATSVNSGVSSTAVLFDRAWKL